jgi:hypothetical protein
MLRLVMTLPAGYQGSIVPMRLGSTVVQGTRAGGACRASPGSGWCTSCGQPAGRDPLNPMLPNEFRMIKSAEETSYLEHVKDRRSQADGDRLTAESLRRRDHPEEFRDAWTAGPSPRRKV